MPPNTQDFEKVLDSVVVSVRNLPISFIGLKAGDLHRKVGNYPGENHRMPICCDVMKKAMKQGDLIIDEPPSGYGASLYCSPFVKQRLS